MIAPLLAAALSAASPAQAPAPDTFGVLLQQRSCGFWRAEPVQRRAPTAPRVQSLGEQPPADMELTVLRFGADGCSRAVVVRRDVQCDGRFPAPRR
jgi:hypothetical protein